MFLICAFILALFLKQGANAGYWMLAGSLLDAYRSRKHLGLAYLGLKEFVARYRAKRIS